MDILIDTHTLLWFVSGDERLPPPVRTRIESGDFDHYISLATYWEIAIKQSLGKLELEDPLQRFMERRRVEGFNVMPIKQEHIAKVATLPFHHRDPFDRLLISQAICEGMTICTQDKHFTAYPVKLTWH